MVFSHISKFQVNVSLTLFLISNTFQNILDGFASFHGQKDIHKKLLRCTLFFDILYLFGQFGNSEFLGKLRNLKDYFLGVYLNACFHICPVLKSETWRQKSLKYLKALNTNSGISLSALSFLICNIITQMK